MRSDVRPLYRDSFLLTLLASIALAPPVAAQTLFAWPDTTVQVTKYATVEQCLAATARVSSGLARQEALTVWRDTMPPDPRHALEPAPALVTETAKRCAARFTEPTAEVADFAPLLVLYLQAGRDADAAALVTRRVASVPAKNTPERTAVEDSAVNIYLAARPTRLDAAERILLARARGRADRIDRIAIYSRLMTAADGVGDTTRARRAAGWVVAVADSLTKAERESEKFETMGGNGGSGKMVVYGAMLTLTGVPTMLDSLRHGTASLVALERSMWARTTGERPDALPVPVGERASTITADHWFPAEAASTPRPRPGHVSLLFFLDRSSCLWSNSGDTKEMCGAPLSYLRRLSEQFPALDVTVVTRTRGSFLYAPPPSPAEEAEMIRRWLEPYRIPRLTVAVTSTPFWNLPRPDGRRIDKDTPNLTNYSFGKGWKPSNGSYLIDQDGIVVSAPSFYQPELSLLIDVLMHRQTGGGEHAAK